MSLDSKRILIIGGRGRVALRATALLRDTTAQVTSLVRTDESIPEVEAVGANALVRDLTTMSQDEWAELFADFDVVVWSAGNGGRGGADVTYAVDRDGALAVIDALASMANPPRFIMVSYVGSLTTTAEDDGGTWYAYVESKKAADLRLLDTDVEFVILAPAALHDDPATGIHVIDNDPKATWGQKTSRELVAEVIADFALRDTLPDIQVFPFVDGADELSVVI